MPAINQRKELLEKPNKDSADYLYGIDNNFSMRTERGKIPRKTNILANHNNQKIQQKLRKAIGGVYSKKQAGLTLKKETSLDSSGAAEDQEHMSLSNEANNIAKIAQQMYN